MKVHSIIMMFLKERCTVHVPIEKPIHDILCVGVNYKDHLEETQTHFDDSFEEPQNGLFYKTCDKGNRSRR